MAKHSLTRSSTVFMWGMGTLFLASQACQGDNPETTSGTNPSTATGIMATVGNTGGGSTVSTGGNGGDAGGAGGGGGNGGGMGGSSGGAGGNVGGSGGTAATTVLAEGFDDATQLTTTDSAGAAITFFSDGTDDYFGIADGAGAGLWNGDAAPSGLKPYLGFAGGFLTAQDLDGEGGDSHVRISWTGLSIAGLSNLQFSVTLAELNDAMGGPDATDFVRVEVQIDGGGFTKILEFFSSQLNGTFQEDVGLDGTADGTALGDTAMAFTKPIAGTGTTLDVRLSVKLDAGSEDIGIDDVTVTAGP